MREPLLEPFECHRSRTKPAGPRRAREVVADRLLGRNNDVQPILKRVLDETIRQRVDVGLEMPDFNSPRRRVELTPGRRVRPVTTRMPAHQRALKCRPAAERPRRRTVLCLCPPLTVRAREYVGDG